MSTAPVDLAIPPPKLIPCKADLWLAWWEDYSGWEGYQFYRASSDADLEAAQHHAAFDWVAEEYAWYDGSDGTPPVVTLEWKFDSNRWELIADGKFTGVTLSRIRAMERADEKREGP